jgi:prepilin-type N-terminal cleavage/methylation domain-containing protein/prepilin-type processing-associated H-X9-DG protein
MRRSHEMETMGAASHYTTLKASTTSRRGRMEAFTLVELLVVISVIAILASLAMPTLVRALRQAQATRCMSNVRQLAVAMQTYALNNGGRVSGIYGPCQPDNQPTWLFHMGPDYDPDNLNVWPDCPGRGQLFPYFHDEKLLLCPADREGNGKFSYSIPQVTAFHIMDQVEDAAQATLFIEEDPFCGIGGRSADGTLMLDRREGGFGCTDRCARRHDGKTTRSFFDGHAELTAFAPMLTAGEFEIKPWGYSCGW